MLELVFIYFVLFNIFCYVAEKMDFFHFVCGFDSQPGKIFRSSRTYRNRTHKPSHFQANATPFHNDAFLFNFSSTKHSTRTHKKLVCRRSVPYFSPFIEAMSVKWQNSTPRLPKCQSEENRNETIYCVII